MTTDVTIAEPMAEATAQGHAHHWVIATPDGAMSRGVCKICGLEKEFPNSAEDGLWERDVPQSRWTGRSEGSDVARSFSEGY